VTEIGATIEKAILRRRAFELYRPPFQYHMGYVTDARDEIAADLGGVEAMIARVRGWGRIGYMKDSEALQDEVGHLIAEALTALWEKNRP
jgi:hypothetical protein